MLSTLANFNLMHTCMQWKQDQNTGIFATVHVSPDCHDVFDLQATLLLHGLLQLHLHSFHKTEKYILGFPA